MRPVELLRQLTDDDRARRVGKALELAEVLVERLACARPLERRPDEERPLDGGRDSDQIACDGLASTGAWCRRAR
jgi:hypothetical protein